MFPNLRNEIEARFGAVERHLRMSPREPADIARTIRGLAFVQIYGAYEYTVRSVANAAVSELASCGHRLRDLRPSLLALFLDAEFKSLRAVGEDKLWDRRLQILELAFSKNPVTAVAAIPHDGTHFRHTHLQMLFRTLGINRALTLRRRHLYLIDEVVNNRNSIAHGEESPTDVGSRFSKQDMIHKTEVMRSVCLRIVTIIGEYCSSPAKHLR